MGIDSSSSSKLWIGKQSKSPLFEKLFVVSSCVKIKRIQVKRVQVCENQESLSLWKSREEYLGFMLHLTDYNSY